LTNNNKTLKITDIDVAITTSLTSVVQLRCDYALKNNSLISHFLIIRESKIGHQARASVPLIITQSQLGTKIFNMSK